MVVIKRWAITFPHQLRTTHDSEDFKLPLPLGGKGLQKILGKNQDLPRFHVPDTGILHLRVDCQKLIGRQGPRRGGPRHKRLFTRLSGSIQNRHLHIDAGIIDFAIAFPDLTGGKTGSTLRPPPDNFLSLIKQASIKESLERPPDTFHKRFVIGGIALIEIDPESDIAGQGFPFLDISEHGFLATANKGFDSVLFNLFLGVDAHILADFDFHRQPVGIPARLAFTEAASHRLVTGEQILHRTGQGMTRVRHSVGSGRSLKEYVFLGSLTGLERLLIDGFFIPETSDFRLDPGEVRSADRFGKFKTVIRRIRFCRHAIPHRALPASCPRKWYQNYGNLTPDPLSAKGDPVDHKLLRDILWSGNPARQQSDLHRNRRRCWGRVPVPIRERTGSTEGTRHPPR